MATARLISPTSLSTDRTGSYTSSAMQIPIFIAYSFEEKSEFVSTEKEEALVR